MTRPDINSPEHIGKTAILEDRKTLIHGINLLLIRVNTEKCFPKYLSYFLKTKEVRTNFRIRCKKAVNQASLNQEDITSIEAPVPSLPEQKRIAAILDKADRLRRQRRYAQTLSNSFLQSVFIKMFGDGKLIPFVNASVNPDNRLSVWQWEKLTEVARLATGHTPSRNVPEYWGSEIPWITLTDIRQLDGTIAHKTSEYTNELGIKNSSAVLLPANTVCLSRTASVGFVTIMGREMATSQDFVNWVCGAKLNPIYLMWALIFSRETITSLSSGTTHKTIYFPTVEEFRILLPPLLLQEKFAAIVQKFERIRRQQREATRQAEHLFQTLLHRAFRGEL